MKNLISSRWALTGNTMTELRRDLAYIDSVTHLIEGCVSEVLLMCPHPAKDSEEGKGVIISYPVEGPKLGILKNVSMYEEHDACFADSAGIMKCRKGMYFMDPNLITSLAYLVNLNGTALADNIPERNNYLAKLFALYDKPMQILYRQNPEEPKQVKAFHAFTSRYTYVPQTQILSLIDEISAEKGRIEVSYVITHYRTIINIDFPEMAKEFSEEYGFSKPIVPGAQILTSDVGTTALTVRGVLRSGSTSGMCFGDVIAKHEGSKEKIQNQLIDNMQKKIFPKYASYMEQFVELLMVSIDNPEEVINWAFEEVKMVKAIGKKNTKALLEFLKSQIDETMSYTAYDIVTIILESLDHISGLDDKADKMFAKALNDIVFLDFEKIDGELTIEIKR